MDENGVRHLEMIQRVVDRLAGNCFAAKAWSVTVVSALVTIAAKDANAGHALLALFPALCFWGLNAYYLRQERLFRALHDAVAQSVRPPIPPFSMDTTPVAGNVKSWARTLVAPTVLWLHLPIVAGVIAIGCWSSWAGGVAGCQGG